MTESSKSFSDYNLHGQLQKAIDDLGFAKCTPIQDRCLPLVLKGHDIAGLAQTGTGKTAAFLIPLVDRVLRSQPEQNFEERGFPDWKPGQFILILVPTRELVTQVYENLKSLTKHTDLGSVFLYGGVGYDEQKDALSKPYQFLVSTPGRLIDLYKEKHLDFKQVRGVVFDEADRMFDMGFQQDVFFILRRIPQDRQLLLFSATLNLQVTEMAYEAHANPVEVDVSRDQAVADNVEDFIMHIGGTEKPKFLLSILKKYNPEQVIIFSNFKSKVPRIAQFLNDNGYSALGISSLMNQNQRNRVIERFKSDASKHNILVATDVAARGLDIKGVDLVINFELPEDAENYVHRIGRTGRAEQKGKAFSFVSDRDVESLMRIQDYVKEKLEAIWLEDADLVTEFKDFPPDEFRKTSFPPRRDRPERGGGDRRPRRGGDRPQRNNDHRPRRSENGEAVNSLEAPPPSVHRDKRSGRHRQNQDGKNRPQNSQNSQRPQQGGPRQDRPGGKKEFSKNNNRHRSRRPQQGGSRPQGNQRPKSAAKSSPGLWGKITSSVKGLFKSK